MICDSKKEGEDMKAVKNQPCCRNCAFAVLLQVAQQAFWVCTNALGRPGQLTPVEPGGTCRQHRPRHTTAVRLAPPEAADDTVRHVPLTKGLFAIVDAADHERVSQYTWFASGNGQRMYAACHGPGRKMILLHRFLTNCPPGMVVDHIDGNGLNDRQSNLRVCTQGQNMRNRRPRGKVSKYKGVSRPKGRTKWAARIRQDGRALYLGHFEDEVEAAKAYDRKAYELFGEYAYLNFPEEIRGGGCRRGVHQTSCG
jgi:hypothetical protein